MKKRFLSLALSAALTLSVLTPAALAAEYVEIIPPKYDEIGESPFDGGNIIYYSDGLAMVTADGKYGFIDTNGKAVVPPKYDYARSFSEGLAAVRLGDWINGKWGFIDVTGKELFMVNYEGVGDFFQGVVIVSSGENGGPTPVQYGLIDKTGKELVPLKYDDMKSFSEGLAAALLRDGKWGYIDTTGKEAIPFKYDYAESFSGGLAAVNVAGKWGYIDTTGKEVIPFKYDYVRPGPDGLVEVHLDDKTSYFDKTGKAATLPTKEDVIPSSVRDKYHSVS